MVRIWEKGVDLLLAEVGRRNLWLTGLDFRLGFELFVEIMKVVGPTGHDMCPYLERGHGLPDAHVAAIYSAYQAAYVYVTGDTDYWFRLWREEALGAFVDELRCRRTCSPTDSEAMCN